MPRPVRGAERRSLSRLFMTPLPVRPGNMASHDRHGIPNFIVFSRDFETADGLRDLCAGLIRRGRTMGVAPILALDEEGGLVSQLKKLELEAPGPRVLEPGGMSLARASGKATGALLRSLGFNLNFAPVSDADTASASPVIGVRSPSPDSTRTGQWCAAWIRAHQGAGVGATAKHFPGHGDAAADSHLTLPVVAAPRALLKRRELPPFLEARKAGVAALMTAHVRYPALDPRRPATLSPRILGMLRSAIGFRGLVVSDSLDMAGVRRFGDGEAPVQALIAGCDLLLYGLPGPLWRRGLLAVEQAARKGRIPAERVEEALEKIDSFVRAYPALAAGKPARPPASLVRRWESALQDSMVLAGQAPPRGTEIRVWGDVPQASTLALELAAHGRTAVHARLSGASRATGRAFHLVVIAGRSTFRPEERRALDLLRSEGLAFGVISLLSPLRLHEREARGARLAACPMEDTRRAVRAVAAAIAGPKPRSR